TRDACGDPGRGPRDDRAARPADGPRRGAQRPRPADDLLAAGARAVRVRHRGRPPPSSARRVNRQYYVSTARRPRRRSRPLAALALLAVVMVAAFFVLRAPGGESGGERRAPLGADTRSPLQLANGPVAATPGPRPLALRLDRTRDVVHLRFHQQPRSGLLFDLDTGEVLWRHAPERVLPIASLTKMMTALVVVDREAADAKVRVTKEALAYKGSGVGVLPRGKRIKL